MTRSDQQQKSIQTDSTKHFLRADDMLRDCFVLARKIYESGCRPDAVLALWRGGAPVGLAVHEYYAHKGHDPYHAVIKVQSYRGIGERGDVVLDRLDHVYENIGKDSTVLVLDDIFDTGLTMKKVVDELSERAGRVVSAVLYYKPSAGRVDLLPDYFVVESDSWIVFPHEIQGLTESELKMKHDDLYKLL